MNVFLFALLLAVLCCHEALATDVDAALDVGQGKNVTNDLKELPVEVYYHVRYATAERFGDPVVADFSEPSPDGKSARVMCPQLPWHLRYIFGAGESLKQTEDCQFLTIFTPSRQGKYPVMVWIHGGAYLTGCGEDKGYDAQTLAREGQIVVVTMNYRLGVFGYLNNIDGGEYNMGLKDQIAALRWVNKYISHFGGDPQRVTIAGESAGAHSVAAIVTNTDEPLFQKAIVQSSPFEVGAKDSDAQKTYNYIRDKLGKDPKLATMEELLEMQMNYINQSSSTMPFGPYDVQCFEKPPNPALRKALVTWMRDDCSIFSGKILGHLENFGSWLDRLFSYFCTYKVFKKPAKQFVKHLEKHGVECDTFQVDWRPEGSPFGAAHAVDVSLMFSSWERWQKAVIMGNATQGEWERQGSALRAKWIEFIKSDLN